MSELAAKLPELRRPFTAEALKWKVQVNPKTDQGKAMLVCYIDARLAAERLNHVVPGLWSDAYEPVEGGLLCRLTVDGVTRCDVGWSSATNTDIGLKALYSDAFKRAAVKFGVGVSIYALPKAFLPAQKLRKGTGQKVTWFLTDQAEAELRQSYNRWLKSKGEAAFGKPLDHGDAEDAQGDIEVGHNTVPDDVAPTDRASRGLEDERGNILALTKEEAAHEPGGHLHGFREKFKLSGRSTEDLARWLDCPEKDVRQEMVKLTPERVKELDEWLAAA